MNTFMEATVILENGNELNLKSHQLRYGLELGSSQIGRYFNIGENSIYNKCRFSVILIKIMDEVRYRWKKPIIINSFDRTKERQAWLVKSGYKASKNSTHELGLAADLETKSNDESEELVKLIEEVAKDLKYKVRIGYKEYQKLGQTFVHLDVAPEYFGKDKPYRLLPHPEAWKVEARW